MSSWLPSWSDIKARWSGGFRALADRAQATYAAALQADPTGTARRVSGFVAALTESRGSLDRIAARLPDPPATDADRQLLARYRDLERRWHDLAAGLYADATPVQAPTVGVAPVLVVGGLVITAVGVSWAVAAYEYAVNLQQQTALAERELEARVEASEAGRVLPPSTLPAPPPSPVDGTRSVGLWLLGGLALAAGVLVVPMLTGRR